METPSAEHGLATACIEGKQSGVAILGTGSHCPMMLLALALLTSSCQLPGISLVAPSWPSVLLQVAADSAPPQQARADDRADRQTKSKARLLAGGALLVLALLALAVALALVRALKS